MFWRVFLIFWRVQAGRCSHFVFQARLCPRVCWGCVAVPGGRAPIPALTMSVKHLSTCRDRAKGTTPAARASGRFGSCYLLPHGVFTTPLPSGAPQKCFFHPQPQFPHPHPSEWARMLKGRHSAQELPPWGRVG